MAREAQTPLLIVIEEEKAGRLDLFLQQHLSDFSRSAVQALIRNGSILVNGAKQKTGYKLERGDRIEGHIVQASREVRDAPTQTLDIVYEDADLILVNKPAGMVVHPGAGTAGQATLVHSVLAHVSRFEHEEPMPGESHRPGVVHRLDKDTSGLIVFAKTALAHRSLSKQFKDKTNLREYVALLDGVLRSEEKAVESYLYRDPRHRTRFSSLSLDDYEKLQEQGQDMQGYRFAKTYFFRRKIYGQRLSLAVMSLDTGRTHQIRVHAKSLGQPVWGDKTYGFPPRLPPQFPTELREALEAIPRQLLHAWRLGFTHPRDGRKLAFEAPLPPDFRSVLELLEKYGHPTKLLT